VVIFEVSPLRQRKDDILPLAKHFLANQAIFYGESEKKLSKQTKELLLNYSWPGNVRELANAIERAYVLTQGQKIDSSALPFEIIIADSVYRNFEKNLLDRMYRINRIVNPASALCHRTKSFCAHGTKPNPVNPAPPGFIGVYPV